MALTRDFRETVGARVARDPAFARALLDEAATLFLNGEPETARTLLRDPISGFVAYVPPGTLNRGKQVAAKYQCATCHGPNGNLIAGVDLRNQQFKRGLPDEDLGRTITNGIPGTGMPPNPLQPAELTGVIAFIRSGFDLTARSVKVGNSARGKSVVEGKGACLTCHRINGVGPRTAPDLSDVGLVRTADTLNRSLTDPAAGLMPINRPVLIAMKDGRTITGRRLNEYTFTVQLIDDKEQLHSLAKSEMRSFVVEAKPRMPSYAVKLTEDEVADVVAYLLSLRGQ